MPQYGVHRNLARSRREFPYFVLVQSGILTFWDRRVVVPFAADTGPVASRELAPVFVVEGRRVQFAAHQIGNVPRSVLGEVVTNLSDDAEKLLNAIDLVLSRGYPY